jgi:hypothetical protein
VTLPRSTLTLGALGLLFGTGCATLSVQRPQVDSVKTLAVVGYHAEVRVHEGGSGNSNSVSNIINTATTLSDLQSGELERERQEQATQTFDLLRAKVAEGIGWTVMKAEDVSAHPAYQEVYEAHKSGVTLLTGPLGTYRTLPYVLTEASARGITPEERGRLLDGLRVDALMVVKVSFVSGGQTGFSMGGMGKTGVLPKAIVDLTVWDRSSPEPIWRDSWAEGEKASVGLDITMGVVNDDQLTAGMNEAAQLAYDVLIRRFKTGG